jgi:hypothetical protein
LRKILGNLRYQTRSCDEVRVYLSDTPHAVVLDLREDFPEYHFSPQPNRNDWGHEKRSIGVAEAQSDYLGFFNDDDSYAMDYVERMMGEAEAGAGVVYCSWNEIAECGFHLGSSTAGNFIVASGLAREVGYNSRAYVADGEFINALHHATDSIARIDEILYFHNVQ